MTATLLLAATGSVAMAQTAYYPAAMGRLPEALVAMPTGTTSVSLVVDASLAHPRATVWQAEHLLTRASTLAPDATPHDEFDVEGGGTSFTQMPLTDADGRQLWFADIVVLDAADGTPASPVSLTVGIDRNRDGHASWDELLCRAVNRRGEARCHVDLRGLVAESLWILTRREDGVIDDVFLQTRITGARFSVNAGKTIALSPFPDSLEVALPETVTTGTSFAAQIHHRALATDPAGVPLGGLLISDSAGAGAIAVPLRFSFTEVVQSGQAYSLTPYETHWGRPWTTVLLQPGERRTGLYVDNPNGSELLVKADHLLGVDVHVAYQPFAESRVDSTPQHWSDTIPEIAVLRQGTLVTTVMGDNALMICAFCSHSRRLLPGRYFIMPVNKTNRPMTVRIKVAISRMADENPPRNFRAVSGNYFNPQRQGDGVFVDAVHNDAIGVFYTFGEDGRPVWYSMAGTSPIGYVWTGTLYEQDRGTRAAGRFVMVADLAMPNHLIFSWNIRGKAGSNRLVLAARSACAPLDSLAAPLSGHWYAPGNPGWGMNVQGVGDATVLGAYFYDAEGRPRWAIGTSVDPGSVKSFAMQQVLGACPSCVYSSPTVTPIGEWTVDFASPAEGLSRPSVQFVAPLRGGFSRPQAVERATNMLSCR
ncbi:hypothetical protein [Tahibacter amnicola]|uniref:Uncharacterized protein n=1 Tax=Tahibacter amnicola TaxID=2976241 RepID=A0ABY6BF99_9GAMM|nr:hypothetical protein [Tahibacter amnicola]UXI67030.1 hypothetical protein N4264_20090 [Tahibacter amnicola]